MNGGYILMPEKLASKVMYEIVNNANSSTGNLGRFPDFCKIILTALKIGKPISMSGTTRNEAAMKDVSFSYIISVGPEYTFTLTKSGEVFVITVSDISSGQLNYSVIGRA